jgi:hypothetical protein
MIRFIAYIIPLSVKFSIGKNRKTLIYRTECIKNNNHIPAGEGTPIQTMVGRGIC